MYVSKMCTMGAGGGGGGGRGGSTLHLSPPSLPPTPLLKFDQERIELVKLAREHVIVHMHYIDGEIQTWQSYSKCG